MAKITPNLSLVNPEKGLGEKYSLALWTANNDKIDARAGVIDAQLEEKVPNFSLENKVLNGDFSQGTSDWLPEHSFVSAADNILTNTGNGLSELPYVTQANLWSNPENKYYLKFKVRAITSDCLYIYFGNYTGLSYKTIFNPSVDEWYVVSDILNYPSSTLFFIHGYASTAIANGKSLQLQYVTVLDLTSIFGAGNEPTKLEMDELMKVIPNEWWDGEISLTQKQVITWQLNLIRKNTNAIIALGGTII